MTRRIAIVLDQKPAPASYDLALLDKLLAQAGLSVTGCHLTYLAPTPGLKGDALQAEAARLTSELASYAPHFVLILDRFGQVMRAFSGEKRSIKEWRGYVWRASAIVPGVKCMGLWHPATVLKDMGLSGEWRFCSTRAAAEARTDLLVVPTRHVEWNLPKDEIVARLRAWRASATPLACDIEGGTGSGPACHGFADSAGHALVVPIYGVDGASWWSEEDEQELTAELAAVWEDPAVPKIIQNASYEVFVLAWSLGIVVRGLRDDTMLKHAELYAEMDKSLEFQAMLYTRQPFWKLHHRYVKAEGRYLPFHGSDPHAPRATSEEWFIYNGTDCCVTYEVNEAMDKQLKAGQRSHYEWNVRCLAPVMYASLRRWRYDKPLAASRQAECQQRLYELQDQINQEAATSGERAELRAFYTACGDLPKDTTRLETTLADNAEQGALSMQRGLLPFLTTAFCSARRTEKREVEEVTWQPMRYNGKRWARAGKRVQQVPEEAGGYGEAIPTPEDGINCNRLYYQRRGNLLTKSVGVPITTLSDVRRFTLPSKQAGCKRALQLVAAFTSEHCTPSSAQRGELATLLGIHLKLNAAGRDKDVEQDDGQHRQGDERDANWFVYRHCGAPPQYAKEAGHLTNRLTSDNAALIASWVATQDSRLRAFMEWRSLDTRLTALEATTDQDGRMGCSYILPGTETMRLACRKSATGTGYNLQTVTEDLRDMFLADEGCYIGQLDLRGADGWGVAAECAQLGDPTMLLDLQAGIKPANIIALIYEHGPTINKLSREELLVRQKSVAKDSWIYIASKKVLYGGCFTGEHELLTPNGWQRIDSIGLGDMIATYDLHTRAIQFENPSHMTRYLYTGSLYSFVGHSIDMTVTADHRMPYTSNGNPKCIYAAELYHRKSGQLPTAGQFFKSILECPGYDSTFGRLIAAIHSDGSYTKRGNRLVFCFKKQRKIERIQKLLSVSGLVFKVYKCKNDVTQVHLSGDQILAYKKWGKQATCAMLSWSKEAMDGYLDEYAHWDGSHKRGNVRSLYSVNKEHLEWIDTFAHLSGTNSCYQGSCKSGFLSTVHQISLNCRSFAYMGSLKKSVVEVKDTPVYCPTVSTSYVMVRRNGKIFASGNCYLMSPPGMSKTLLKDSYKETGVPVFVQPKKCKEIQEQALFLRYPGIKRWHESAGRRMMADGRIVTSLGWSRSFFGRKSDMGKPNRQTLGEWLGTVPQFYTTAATKLAMMRLWDDPTNRHEDCSLRVELLHTVHDSLNPQWQVAEHDYARGKLVEWFQNPITIAGTALTIPASGTYGLSWGDQGKAL